MRWVGRIAGIFSIGMGLWVLPAAAADPESARLGQLEDSIRALKDEVVQLRSERRLDQARIETVRDDLSLLEGGLGRVKLGGYGSLRWDNSSLRDSPSTFTLRRLVVTTAAELGSRLRFYSELEYERFRKLELERSTRPVSETENVANGIKLVQEVEGTSGSEIALEQAWLEFDLTSSLRLRTGAVLVPLGRFNTNHDDNAWNLTRRSLVDRGAPVLPAKAAWDELGIGLLGELPLAEGSFGWELYVVNGVTLEAELEEVAAIRQNRRDKIELELEFSPQTGTFSNDLKEAKAIAGRFAWRPSGGQELALSFYRGRYTPSYLADETAWSLALDGIGRFGGFELEGEYVFTRFEGVRNVSQSLAAVALESAVNNSAAFDPTVESEIEIDVKNLADAKHGYWLELRRPFWPTFLSSTPLGRGFDNPLLIPVLRWEQVFFLDRITSIGFTAGSLNQFTTENRVLSRISAGLAYRPSPLIAFTMAYEYLFANKDNLDGLTSFLPAGVREDAAHSLSFGATFGF